MSYPIQNAVAAAPGKYLGYYTKQKKLKPMPGSSKYTSIMQFLKGKESFNFNQAALILLLQLLESKRN